MLLPFTEKELDGQQVVQEGKLSLIKDNFTAHPFLKGLQGIEMIFLLPNTTSKTQPMDQGVIRILKAFYRASSFRGILLILIKTKILAPIPTPTPTAPPSS